jgi:hypothetical protein
MGYFDGLVSGSFKTAQDGRKLFFPWGILGSGYAIPSDEQYQRLRSQVKAYLMIGLLLIIGSGAFAGYPVQIALGGGLMAFYLLWMWRTLSGLKRSDEALSLNESMTSQAKAHGAVVLWLLEIVSILFGRQRYMDVADRSEQLAGCTRRDFVFRDLSGQDHPHAGAPTAIGQPSVLRLKSTGTLCDVAKSPSIWTDPSICRRK